MKPFPPMAAMAILASLQLTKPRLVIPYQLSQQFLQALGRKRAENDAMMELHFTHLLFEIPVVIAAEGQDHLFPSAGGIADVAI